jgi:cytochrome c-type biogenesis protein
MLSVSGGLFSKILEAEDIKEIKRLLEVRKWSGWITPTSGVLLIGFGIFSLLGRIPSY